MPQLLLKGNPIGLFKGVLFDKDGTISNSEEHLKSLAKLRIEVAKNLFKARTSKEKDIILLQKLLAKAYGINSKGINPTGTIAIGSKSQNLISTATVFTLIGEGWPKAWELANETFRKVDIIDNQNSSIFSKRSLLPGILKLLKSLQASGIICGVISNDTHSGIQKFLSSNDLESYFSASWSADNQPTKPNPIAVKELCKRLRLVPTECALIGDADSDLLMAKQAGIGLSLGYIAGWSNPPQLTEHQQLIYHWDELSVEKKPKVLSDIGAK